MNRYTVEYKMTYDMTVEVEADSEEEAFDKARDEALDGNGFEHDISYHGFDIIDTEEEEPSQEEIDAQKGDMKYREMRDA